MRLSDRLETIIHMVPPCRAAADIGTDHGFVPIELVRRGISKKAIAADVRKGPLTRAEMHVEKAALSEKISLRLGSGLTVLRPGEVDVVILAGMGGILMAELLNEAPEVLLTVRTLILSPHSDPDCVRRSVQENDFHIANEAMVEEEGKFYVVMKCVPGARKRKYSSKELLYGPVLLRKRPEVFLRFIGKEKEKVQAVLEKLRENQGPEKVIFEKGKALKMLETIGRTGGS